MFKDIGRQLFPLGASVASGYMARKWFQKRLVSKSDPRTQDENHNGLLFGSIASASVAMLSARAMSTSIVPLGLALIGGVMGAGFLSNKMQTQTNNSSSV